MQIKDKQKKMYADSVFSQFKDSYELLANENLDDESLAYLAERLAWSWKIDQAIILLKHGVYASPVITWAHLFSPEKVEEVKNAEQCGFYYIYNKDPIKWKNDRDELIAHLERQKNKDGSKFYSQDDIDYYLKKLGYAINI